MFIKTTRETTEYAGESFEINLIKNDDWADDDTAKYELWGIGGNKVVEGQCNLDGKHLTATVPASVTESLHGEHRLLVFYTTAPHNDVMFEYLITYKDKNE